MYVASLPMYDFPELRAATDALWAAIARRLPGIDAPAALTRDASWTNPGLLLGQTCGYPLVTSLAGCVALIATPCYRAPGCDGACYRSAIIVRVDDPAENLADLRGRRCALNDATSNSGMNLLRAEIATIAAGADRFFTEMVTTGAHAASVDAVASGRADVAAIDCITWAHLQHLRSAATQNLRVLSWTAATPGLPFITSTRTDAKTRRALLRALEDVSHDPSLAEIRAALLLQGFEALPLSAYDAVLTLQQRARAAGYPLLR